MTLVVGAVTERYALLVTDRAVVSDTGRRHPFESTKSVVLRCNNARLAVAYTGAAIVPSPGGRPFIVEAKLVEALRDAALPDSSWPEMATRLRASADSWLPELGSEPLTIVCVGFTFHFDADRRHFYTFPELYMISNCETLEGSPKPAIYWGFHQERVQDFNQIVFCGQHELLSEAAAEAIIGMVLDPYYSAGQVIETTVDYIREASKRHPASISEECNSVVFGPDWRERYTAYYHHAGPGTPDVGTWPSYVDAFAPKNRVVARSPLMRKYNSVGDFPLTPWQLHLAGRTETTRPASGPSGAPAASARAPLARPPTHLRRPLPRGHALPAPGEGAPGA